VIGLVVRYALILLVARHYGAHGLGIYTLSIALGLVASLFATMGMDWAVTRFVPFHGSRGEDHLRLGLERLSGRLVAVASLFCAVALASLSAWFASVFHDEALLSALRIIALAVPAMALGQLWRARLRATETVRAAVFLEQVAIPGVNLAVVFVFVALGSNWLYAPVLGHSAGQVLAALIPAALLLRRRGRTSRFTLALRPWFSYGAPMWLEAGLLMLLGYADQLMLGHFVDVVDVGHYAPATRLAALVGIPLLAVNAVLGPMIARLDGAGSRDELQRLYVRVNWATAVSGLLIGVGLCAVGYPLLSVFGPGYTAAFPAFVILVAGQLIATVTGSAGTLLASMGHSKVRLGNATAALFVNVVLGFSLIPRYGVVGAAASTSIALTAISVVQLLEVRGLLRMSTFDRQSGRFWVTHARQLAAWRPRP
jgi:O-antigen/teichoic acid export membrane protein